VVGLGDGGDDSQAQAAAGGDLDVDLAAGDVVADRIVDQVGRQPLQQPGIAGDGRRRTVGSCLTSAMIEP
jgi:hypothetical protein